MHKGHFSRLMSGKVDPGPKYYKALGVRRRVEYVSV